jgi:hypothetical protein
MNLISSDGSILILSKDCVTDVKVANPSRFSISTAPTSSFLFSGNGTNTPLSGNVRLSAQSGNTLLLKPDGLYVTFPSYTETLLSVIDTTTINLTTSGLSAHTLKADIRISGATGNAIIVKPDGIFASVSSNEGGYTDAQARNAISALLPLTYNNTTGVLGINKASNSQAGYLSSADWTLFNSKEPAIGLGNTSQYWRGDKTWQILNTTVVTEGTNLYFTAVRARNTISALAPIFYNNVTGVITSVVANNTQDGYLSSSDWTTFMSKVSDGISLASVNAQSVYKDKSGNILEFRGVRGRTGIVASLVGDDIVLDAIGTVPVANAGTDKSVVLPTTSVTMTGTAVTAAGTITSTTWLFLSGPTNYTIADASSLNTIVTGLAAGTYTFRLVVVNSFGLVNTDDVVIVVSGSVTPLDTIYYGASSVGTTPTESDILAGLNSTQNGALNVNADWTSFNGSPQFCFFAIPDNGAAYEKNKWYIDPLNNGSIGSPSDLFGALSVVTVSGNAYSVGITNYPTQFIAVCQLQKV